MDAPLEDVHMNVERRLTELIGDAGARLHTARSRNDQVATDLRLYARAQAAELGRQIAALQRALVTQAKRAPRHADAGLHAPAAGAAGAARRTTSWPTCEMLARDRGRLADAARRMNESPLGSGALAGDHLSHRSRGDGARRSASSGRRPTASTRSAIATSRWSW